MLRVSRFATLTVFLLLGLSFLAGTGTLIFEFWDTDWFTIATHDSHLFLFFPTLGLIALAAFYVPALAFVDMYWRGYVAWGRARFFVGFAILTILSVGIALWLNSSPYRPAWDIPPALLSADKATPAGCEKSGKPCDRVAILDTLEAVRTVSHARMGLRDFIRRCEPEPLIEASATIEQKRFCFASTPLSDRPPLTSTAECCQSQRKLQEAISTLAGTGDKRSLTGRVHAVLLPFKVFFLLLLGAIGMLLAVRYKSVAQHYPHELGRIELGVLVGAGAMLFFPLMSQAFVQTADALYGTAQNAGFKPIVNAMSVAFAVWALLLLMFFYNRHNRELEVLGKMAGVMASAIAVLKFDLMISLVVRYLGSGAGLAAIIVLLTLSIASVLVLLSAKALNFFDIGDGIDGGIDTN
jgi:hypothetical protein